MIRKTFLKVNEYYAELYNCSSDFGGCTFDHLSSFLPLLTASLKLNWLKEGFLAMLLYLVIYVSGDESAISI